MASLSRPAILATLVGVQGSSYRRPGARLLLDEGGPRLGAVSGGCLEADLQERVATILASGHPRLLTYDLGSELDLLWGTGMGCEGVAEVLLEPLAHGQPWVRFCLDRLSHRQSCALATVLEHPGHPLGTRFVLGEDGTGLLPDERELRVDLRMAARKVLATGRPETLRAEDQRILVEPLLPPFALWIYGAGEGARPLARMAKEAGWETAVLDHRPALANAQRFPEADHLRPGPPSRTLADLRLDRRSAAVVMSHILVRDKEAVSAFLRSGASYVGLLGHRARGARILRELQDEGLVLTEAMARSLHTPAGLDLGGDTPQAIALSILAEAQAVLGGRTARSLKEGVGAIHR